MNLLALCAAAVVICSFALFLRQTRPDFALLLQVCAGCVLLLFLFGRLYPILTELSELSSTLDNTGGYVKILLKALGICIVTQIVCDICRDGGASAMASKVELGGRVSLLLTIMPLIRQLFSLAGKLIDVKG